jgi:hypothetical protein
LLRRAGVANTVLVLPQPDLDIEGTLNLGGETLSISGARGGQAHLWGSKHAGSWAWVHCNDFRTLEGEAVVGAVVDAVSVIVPRLGRDVGPNTPVVGCIDGVQFASTATMRLHVYERARQVGGWVHRQTLVAPQCAHFEYAQRTPVAGLELLTT